MINIGKAIKKTIEVIWKPQCTHDIPPVYLLYFPVVLNNHSVLNGIPQCTEHVPVYCTPPVYCTDIMHGVYILPEDSSRILSDFSFSTYLGFLFLISQ